MRISKRTKRGHLAYAGITDVRSSYEEDVGDSVVSLSCAVSICEVNNEQEHVTRLFLCPPQACLSIEGFAQLELPDLCISISADILEDVHVFLVDVTDVQHLLRLLRHCSFCPKTSLDETSRIALLDIEETHS